MKKEVSLIFRGLTLRSPLVSVVLVTRQHAESLRRCLDGILGQYTTFDIEVVVVDRGSTDETGDICQEYKAVYPEKVRFYTRVPGEYPGNNRLIQLHGDFGIVCRDGELWSDSFKLQRQTNFLMTHPGYDLCFHNVRGSYMPHMHSRDYLPGEITSGKLFRYYSPLFRLSGRRSSHHFSLYERVGGEIFARYSFRGKMRCLGDVCSDMIPDKNTVIRIARLPFMRSVPDWED